MILSQAKSNVYLAVKNNILLSLPMKTRLREGGGVELEKCCPPSKSKRGRKTNYNI